MYHFQYRMKQQEWQNGPLPEQEKVCGWLRCMQAANSSDGPSSQLTAQYPTSPAAPRNEQYVSVLGSEEYRQCPRLD